MNRAWTRLLAGNVRFVQGRREPRNDRLAVRRTAGGQQPFAVVLGCIDSRVPPETVFDQGIGDIFAARTAGNYADRATRGGLEFTTALSTARLVVVLGHTDCGAIQGAMEGVRQNNLTYTLAELKTAVKLVPDGNSTDVAIANVRVQMQRIRKDPGIGPLLRARQVGLVGAMYDVTTGRVMPL